MDAWRYGISPRDHVLFSIYTTPQFLLFYFALYVHTTYHYTYPFINYLNTSSYSFYDFYLRSTVADVAA